MKVVVVNGFPRSGKDTFVDFCIEDLNALGSLGIKYSTVGFVKQVATYCGWNGEKTLKNRKFLSDLKNLLTDWDDIPFKKTKKFIENFKERENCFIFVMCREPEEIKRLKDEFDAITIFVDRKEAANAELSNNADKNVRNFDYDIIINNDGTLEQLKEQTRLKFWYF